MTPEPRLFSRRLPGRIGRENAMFIAFGLETVGITLFALVGGTPVMFVVLTTWVFFGWGEIYSLFPSTSADTYGWKYAATNAGALYTAKGTASLLVPFLSGMSFQNAFLVSGAMAAVATIMSQVVLKPMRRRMLAELDRQALKVETPEASAAV